jgi:hypothetical protein
VQVDWSVAAVLTGLLGFQTIGPSAFIVMALATHVVIPDFRETHMPYLSSALRLVDSGEGIATRAVSIRRITLWLSVMLSSGFVVAGAVTFYLQYNHSVLQAGDQWATHWNLAGRSTSPPVGCRWRAAMGRCLLPLEPATR